MAAGDQAALPRIRSKCKNVLFFQITNCILFSNQQVESHFCNITEVLLQIFDNDIEIYWMAKGFNDYSQEILEEMGKLSDLTGTILEKEDNGLYIHLKSCDILPVLPLEKWYGSFFAGVLSELAIIRIWDKICGGSIKIVIFVLIEILRTLRRRVLRCMDLKSLLECIESVSFPDRGWGLKERI